jgi:hypothetical protein
LNPTNANERVPSVASQSYQFTNLYDRMEIDEDMALSMVKEQLNLFRINKVIKEECKDLLAWRKMHEKQFSYVEFVPYQNLKIVSSQFEVQ